MAQVTAQMVQVPDMNGAGSKPQPKPAPQIGLLHCSVGAGSKPKMELAPLEYTEHQFAKQFPDATGAGPATDGAGLNADDFWLAPSAANMTKFNRLPAPVPISHGYPAKISYL